MVNATVTLSRTPTDELLAGGMQTLHLVSRGNARESAGAAEAIANATSFVTKGTDAQ